MALGHPHYICFSKPSAQGGHMLEWSYKWIPSVWLCFGHLSYQGADSVYTTLMSKLSSLSSWFQFSFEVFLKEVRVEITLELCGFSLLFMLLLLEFCIVFPRALLRNYLMNTVGPYWLDFWSTCEWVDCISLFEYPLHCWIPTRNLDASLMHVRVWPFLVKVVFHMNLVSFKSSAYHPLCTIFSCQCGMKKRISILLPPLSSLFIVSYLLVWIHAVWRSLSLCFWWS